MRTFRIFFVLAIVLGCSGSAWSQEQSSRPSAEAMAAARELVKAAGAADQVKAILPILTQSLRAAIVHGRPEIARDYDLIMPKILESVTERAGDFAELIAIVYANNFTAGELKELTAFHLSPIGRKLHAKQSIIAQQSMVAGQTFGKALVEQLRPRIIEELRKRGHNI